MSADVRTFVRIKGAAPERVLTNMLNPDPLVESLLLLYENAPPFKLALFMGNKTSLSKV